MSRTPHVVVCGLCLGIALANAGRVPLLGATIAAALLFVAVASLDPRLRPALIAAALVMVGWWWGSARLDALDRSILLSRVDTAERAMLVTTGPARSSRFQLRVPAQVRRFGRLRFRESVLLELPRGRAPPQGGLLEAITTVRLPRAAKNGFDERAWLRHQGVHVVLHADRWKLIGRRGGLAGVGDRLRALLYGSVARGLDGTRRGVVEGVVLGDEQALPEGLRNRFRSSGLYHLLAVSGQNVALVAAGALVLAWLLGLPRWCGQFGAIGAIAAYVLAVGAQPSVIRAGVAGVLGSLAWLAARPADRWYFLLLGALVLLAWNPYDALDAGFQLSFVAVAAIFVAVPRLGALLDGYPLPAKLGAAIAVATACGLATAPILWLQFHAVPLLTVPANALAEPAVAPLLYLAFAAGLTALIFPPAASAIAWVNGWNAAYLAGCARLFGSLPGAQVRSGRGLTVVLALAAGGAAYAWRRWQSSLRSTSLREQIARRSRVR
ncbi:MAG TPA: ComEC/Rec2 family competence protein [Gaiellaceae bacterium]